MEQKRFREICGSFTTGVTVVTTKDERGNPVGMTANSFTSLSLDPPLILFNIDKGASLYETFMKTDSLAINILSKEQQSLSKQFASSGIDRFDGVQYCKDKTGAPILSGVLAYFDCEIEHRYDGGDHTIIIGKVVSGDSEDGEPLVFYKGNYKELTV